MIYFSPLVHQCGKEQWYDEEQLWVILPGRLEVPPEQRRDSPGDAATGTTDPEGRFKQAGNMPAALQPGVGNDRQQVQTAGEDIPFIPFQHPDQYQSVSLYW